MEHYRLSPWQLFSLFAKELKGYSDEFKEQVLKEVEDTGNISLVARNRNIPSTTIYTWIKRRKGTVNSISSRGPKSNSFNSINYKKVYRLSKELRIMKNQRVIRPAMKSKISVNKIVKSSNLLWEA